MARKKFTTTLEENLIIKLKTEALMTGKDGNEILENLLIKYFAEKENEVTK